MRTMRIILYYDDEEVDTETLATTIEDALGQLLQAAAIEVREMMDMSKEAKEVA